MTYTVCIINDKRVVRRAKDYCFDSIEEANNFAAGIATGLWVANKRWSVALVKDDILAMSTIITKEMTSKRMVLLMREYVM